MEKATVEIVIVVGIVGGQAVMTMGIVGPQDAHHTEEVVIILHQGILHMAEDQGGIDPGLLMVGEAKFGNLGKLDGSVMNDISLNVVLEFVTKHTVVLVWSACFFYLWAFGVLVIKF